MATESIIPNSILFNKKQNFRKGPKCPLSGTEAPDLDYKNIQLLKKFISEKGRILPRRISNVSSKKQRALKIEINRARTLALLPFSAV